jgi:long-chain acyl-CoA synthetase
MVYGDRRPHLVGLLVPDMEELARFKDDPAAIQEALGKAVDRVNRDLSIIERIRRFIVADAPFTVENEQLTPSMKIRRHILTAAYGDRLGALYGK